MDSSSAALSKRPLMWWDVATAGVLVFQAIIGSLDAQLDPLAWMADLPAWQRTGLVIMPLLLIGCAYVWLGRSALRWGMRWLPLRATEKAFLAVIILLLFFAVFTTSFHAVLQVLVYPMIWTINERYRSAVLWSAAAATALGISILLSGAYVAAAITAPLSFLFAVAMGTWITRIAEQGERHRETAEQLRATQQRVTVLSEAAGAAAERERLSRELHDTLTQTLTGLVMLSEQAERALAAGDADRAGNRLTRVSSAAREAMTEARALVATTQPLGEGGLGPALERVADRLRSDTGLLVRCGLAVPPLDREQEVVLLRAAQEGLANARRHAQASAVRVELRPVEADRALLRIEDDGIGPNADAASSGGFGLSGLAERVRAAGGVLSFGPGADRGALLEVVLPCRAPRLAAGSAGSADSTGRGSS